MPYTIRHVKGGSRPWKLIKKDTGEIVGSSTSEEDAKDAMRARYAHSPEDAALRKLSRGWK